MLLLLILTVSGMRFSHFVYAHFDNLLQMLIIDTLGRSAAQPENGAAITISICPEKMTTFSCLGGYLACP